MSSCFKKGRIVIILNGRHAGKKAIVIKDKISSGNNSLLNNIGIIGIKNLPSRESRKKQSGTVGSKRRIKVFLKLMNKNHVIPTRYFVDLNPNQQTLISNISNSFFDKKMNRDTSDKFVEENMWQINNIFMDKYFSGKNKWFFKTLKF